MLNVTEIKRTKLTVQRCWGFKIMKEKLISKVKKKCRDVEDLMCTMHNLL